MSTYKRLCPHVKKINKITFPPLQSLENSLKGACAYEDLEPQSPSLITILKGIREEILPAEKKKKVRKASSREGTCFPRASSASYHDIDLGLYGLSVWWGLSPSKTVPLQDTWYQPALDTSYGQALYWAPTGCWPQPGPEPSQEPEHTGVPIESGSK